MSSYFHTDDARTVRWLASVLDTAADNEQRVRFDVDREGRLRVKRGESTWSAPIASTPDPYRDGSCDHDECQQQRHCFYM